MLIFDNTFAEVFHVGENKLKRLLAQAPGNFVDDHGNKGRGILQKGNADEYADLKESTEYLKQKYSAPFATRVVHNKASFLDTQDNGKALLLPLSLSMRQE